MPSTDSEARRPPIPASRKNWTPCAGTGGRHGPEWVDGMAQNGWTASIGIDGRHGLDYAATLQVSILCKSYHDPVQMAKMSVIPSP
jgi:hypothetical protein